MNLLHALVVTIACTTCCYAQLYKIRCDTVADGCDDGSTYSVENFIASFSPTVTGAVEVVFDTPLLTLDGFSNLTNHISSLSGALVLVYYPSTNFSHISGDLTVGEFYVRSDDLVTFDGFDKVAVSGKLSIKLCGVLESLNGIDPLKLGNGIEFSISHNPSLVDWTALNGLSGQMDAVAIYLNNATRELGFLDNVTINKFVLLESMGSLTTLSKLTLTPSPAASTQVYFVVQGLPSLRNFGGVESNNRYVDYIYFDNLPKVGDWDWTGFNFEAPTLRYVSMFVFQGIGGHINFVGAINTRPMFFTFENTGVRNFDNLLYNATAPYVGGVTLVNNPDLTSIAGLRGIGANGNGSELFYQLYNSLTYATWSGYDVSVDMLLGITIENNPSLTSLDGLQDVDVVVGELRICGNDALTSLTGLEGLGSVRDQPNVVGSGVFQSLNYPATFQGYLRVCDNANLASVSLPSLEFLMGSFTLDNNPSLTAVDVPLLIAPPPSGLLYSVNGGVNVTGFSSCVDCERINALYNITASGTTNIDTCTVYADACAGPNPCLHGGLCSDDLCDDTSYTCNCTGTGWPLGSHCNATVCGDGVVAGNETCDDGNSVGGDGCENNCTLTIYTSSSTSTSSSSSSSTSSSTSSFSSTAASPTTTTASTTTSPATTATATATADSTSTTSSPDDEPTSSTEEEVVGTSDAGQIEADRRARARRIGAAVGGSLGGICLVAICVAIGVATGMGGTMMRDSGKVSATADEEMGSYSHSNDSTPSSSSASAQSTSVDLVAESAASAASSAEASES